MKTTWRTAWQGSDIVVFRNDVEVDRLAAPQIERVILIYRGAGETPGDLVRAVVEIGDDCLIFPAETGFAGRVNFERQAFWAEKACVWWVPESRAPLPLRLRRSRWLFGLAPGYSREPRGELSALLQRWPVQGPQTWEQRKWRRIEQSRPFAPEPTETRLRA